MSQNVYDDGPRTIRRLAPASPVVIWTALMVAALGGAGATLLRGGAKGPDERLVATATEDRSLRRDVARLASERDELAGRLAALERGVGEIKLSMRDPAPETTGSIGRQGASPSAAVLAPVEARSGGFGLSLGADASLEAVRRRWSALSARYPQVLAKLTPRAQRGDAPGVFDLVAGPFVSRPEAERACGTLAQQGFACDTTAYAGEPLGRP